MIMMRRDEDMMQGRLRFWQTTQLTPRCKVTYAGKQNRGGRCADMMQNARRMVVEDVERQDGQRSRERQSLLPGPSKHCMAAQYMDVLQALELLDSKSRQLGADHNK